jgi:cystathionine beta-lyase/cystathionine gamma-synthase
MSIGVDFIDAANRASWRESLTPQTRAIYVETISNPLMQVADLRGAVEFARAHGLISIIDNTFASPINFRPPEHGFDLSLHSCTKYLNGHSDIVAGAIVGRATHVNQCKALLELLGGSLDPHACFLLHRGMKTLALRMTYQNRSTQALAEFLSRHPQIARVNYPGLASHPRHDRARSLFLGFGGVLSFEAKDGLPAAEKFLQKARLPIQAPSLGGVETLMTRPAMTSHRLLPVEDRARLGVTDSLIRISVGIESTEDLIEDFDQALGD